MVEEPWLTIGKFLQTMKELGQPQVMVRFPLKETDEPSTP